MSTDASSAAAIANPQGGGALHGIGEKFSPDLHTGTGNFVVPLELPNGRNGFQPRLSLGYSTGNGNGPFGLGWALDVPAVSRKTKGVPRHDAGDVFILSGAEDLVPVPGAPAGAQRYRPRTEGLFARIDHHFSSGTNYWRVWSRDGLVSLYGTPRPDGATAAWSDPAVVSDPANAAHVFAWRLSRTEDTFGNRIEYLYERDPVREDGPHQWDQLYLSTVRYVDYGDLADPSFLVTVSFVYEGRPDPFSDYRAGFEIRTVRRCTRIDVATHADGETPVRSYHLIYADQRNDLPAEVLPLNRVSLLSEIRLEGRDGDESEWLPPLEFGYTRFDASRRDFVPITGLELPPRSLAAPDYELVDLFGNGLPSVLALDGSARYWRNRGNATLDLPHDMSDAPAGLRLSDPGVQIVDADGDGRADLLVSQDSLNGYFPMRFGGLWDSHSFRRYQQAPSFDVKDPEVRLVDIDGDGVTDAMRSGTRLECYFNDQAVGWNGTRQIERRALDEFPDVEFSDPRVKLADMTGDRLQDIVLVHAGSIRYWASRGWGDWSPSISMRGPPQFPAGYDPRRVLIGDVDGDGLADVVYVDDTKITLWINQAGNGFADPIEIEGTPPVSDVDAIRLTDLLGTGVSGVLWSSDDDGTSSPRMFFHDFTGGVKPYLLNEIDNHIGAVTRVEYAPSTRFYLEDERDLETRWRTPLPFAVQVVSGVTTIDRHSGGKLTTQYRYRYGYWDGLEQEFRGFASVSQFDTQTLGDYHDLGIAATESFQAVSPHAFSPPTEVRTLFHIGAVGDEEGGWGELDLTGEFWSADPPTLTRPPPTTALLKSLSAHDRRDALRALRGSVLRTELYALDGSPRANRPYTVTEHAFGLREESPPGPAENGRKRIFFPHLVCERTTQWERGDVPMTRVTYAADYDAYGQELSRTSIAVPRTEGEPYLAKHVRTTHAQRDDDDRYIVDRVARTTSYEIVNDGSGTVQELCAMVEEDPTGWPVIGQTISYYDGDPFVGLPIGTLGEHAALVRREQLVLTEQLLHEAYTSGAASDVGEEPPYLASAGSPPWTNEYPTGFRELVPDLAGYVFRSGGSEPEELPGYFTVTEQRRYDVQGAGAGRGLVTAIRDPLAHETAIAHDTFALLPLQVIDPVGLSTSVVHDYRMLQPREVIDPNGNRTVVTFSPLGLPATAMVMGRQDEAVGDTLEAPSLQFVYDFHDFTEQQQPISVRTIRRVHHVSQTDIPLPQREETIELVEYSDGFGRLLQIRGQAEDQLFGDPIFGGSSLSVDQSLIPADAVGAAVDTAAGPRVVVSGSQLYDNKGRVVEKYEPFFSLGWTFAPPIEQEMGAKTSLRYDALGRVTQTLNPDGSEQQVVRGVPNDVSNPSGFEPTPWEIYTYDANDNAGRTHPVDSANYAAHWNTPASATFDGLGRTIRSTVRSGSKASDVFHTRSTYDLRGNVVAVTDELGRLAFWHIYDLANRRLRMESLDAGVRRTVFDAAGNAIEHRDSVGAVTLRAFDVLNRPTRLWARDDDAGVLTLRERLEYGDGGDAAQLPDEREDERKAKRLGRLHRHYDEAGLLVLDAYDFKGNLLEKLRRVIADGTIFHGFEPAPSDWQVRAFRVDWEPPSGVSVDDHAASLLDSSEFRLSSTYDALNRLERLRYPEDVLGGRRELRTGYSRAGALQHVSLDDETFIEHIAYNARGQRTLIAYGAGIFTRYAYHPNAFRLARLRTERYVAAPGPSYHPTAPALPLQDLAYEYDLAGNVVRITDRTPGGGVAGNPDQLGAEAGLAALLAVGNALIRRFTYDPLYRLQSATGRECKKVPAPRRWADEAQCGYDSGNHGTPDQSNAPQMTRLYRERYEYDPAGNLVALKHTQDGQTWSRLFGVDGLTPAEWEAQWGDHIDTDLPWPDGPRNTLTHVAESAEIAQTHFFDENGRLIRETTSRHFEWDQAERMKVCRTQTEGAEPSLYASYLYDSSGRRVKKLVRQQGGALETRILIDGIFEREQKVTIAETVTTDTLHLVDGSERIATVRVGPAQPDDATPAVKLRLADHLGSSVLVMSLGGEWVNREEYTPYGETVFGGFAHKRFRFSGRPRDEESGLAYHGARYYASWLGRWVSCDPAGPVDGLNLYRYASANPMRHIDASGTQSELPPPATTGAEPSQTSADPALNMSGRDDLTGGYSSSSAYAGWASELNESQATDQEAKRVGRQLLSGTYKSTAVAHLPPHFPSEKEAEYWASRGFEFSEQIPAEQFGAGLTCGLAFGPGCEMEGAGATLGATISGFHPASGLRDIYFGAKQISHGETLLGVVNFGAGIIGLVPVIGGEAKAGIKATLSLGKAETSAVRKAIGAGAKMTRSEIGQAAELSAAWALHGEGHEVIGSIQNASGHGIDLVTLYQGEYHVWEVKGNTARLSAIQSRPAEFVGTRVYDAAVGNPGAFDKASQEVAAKVWAAMSDNRVTYGSFNVRFSF